jgi:hypothetical protein
MGGVFRNHIRLLKKIFHLNTLPCLPVWFFYCNTLQNAFQDFNG